MPARNFVIAVILLLATSGAMTVISARSTPSVVRTNLELLPVKIGAYTGREDSFHESVYRELNADKHIYRHYTRGGGSDLDLYIGYYGTAKGGRTGHNPYACLSGSGWGIVDTSTLKLSGPQAGSDAEVNYIHARKDGINTIMVHWYQTAGTRVISTGLEQNIERFIGRIFHNRNDGAFVRISMNVPHQDVLKAKAEVSDFAAMVLLLLPRYWPEEK